MTDLTEHSLLECSSLSANFKRRKTAIKKKEKKEIADVPWELFDVENYVQKMKNDRLLIFGVSGEGKSFFAAQLLICKIISNIKNKIITIFEATSESNDAEILIENIGDIVLNLFPELKETWDTDKCPVHFSHSSSIKNMSEQLDNFKIMNNAQLMATEKIWYFDDVGTTFSTKTKNISDFFDDLCSRGRHYNITSIFCTQKLDIPKIILNSANNICFVGILAANIWETFKKKCGFHLGSTNDNFYKHYSTRIGIKNSRNILVIDKTSNCVYLHKVSNNFVKIWEPMMKKEII